jgi:hypothetical protein
MTKYNVGKLGNAPPSSDPPPPGPLFQKAHDIFPQKPYTSSSSAAGVAYSEGDSEIPPSKTPARSILASCLARANIESNPLRKSSRYSPGIFPPGEKEKEEGVDGGMVSW